MNRSSFFADNTNERSNNQIFLGGRNLKIQSAYAGMDSAGSRASVTQTKAYVLTAGIGSAHGWDEEGSKSFSQLLSDAGNKEEKQEEGATQAGKVIGFWPVENGKIVGNAALKNQTEQQMQRSIDSIREACVQFLIKWLYDTYGLRRRSDHAVYDDVSSSQINATGQSDNTAMMLQTGGSSGSYMEATYYHEEFEFAAFSSKGQVVTEDGRTIDFNLELSMTRRFMEYAGISQTLQPLQMTDPLVINIDAPIAQVSDQKFTFDIDADGILDQVSMPTAGSGFLALDKNGDGKIGDGTELFGTKSGDGFADLAEYDADGNGWIDENDEIFEKLLVWCKDADGTDQLYTLKESGVGAICLQSAPTGFTMQSHQDFSVNARIRSTGIFLYENGGAGTIQQVDFAG